MPPCETLVVNRGSRFHSSLSRLIGRTLAPSDGTCHRPSSNSPRIPVSPLRDRAFFNPAIVTVSPLRSGNSDSQHPASIFLKHLNARALSYTSTSGEARSSRSVVPNITPSSASLCVRCDLLSPERVQALKSILMSFCEQTRQSDVIYRN